MSPGKKKLFDRLLEYLKEEAHAQFHMCGKFFFTSPSPSVVEPKKFLSAQLENDLFLLGIKLVTIYKNFFSDHDFFP